MNEARLISYQIWRRAKLARKWGPTIIRSETGRFGGRSPAAAEGPKGGPSPFHYPSWNQRPET